MPEYTADADGECEDEAEYKCEDEAEYECKDGVEQRDAVQKM